MLGTRRYENVAIDLWQGSLHDFASDILVVSQYKPDETHSFVKIEEGSISYPAPETYLLQYPHWNELHKLWSSYLGETPVNKRHLTIAFTCTEESVFPADQVKQFFVNLKNFLDSAPKELGRVSLVFESLPVHDIFQGELFAVFPYQE